MLPSGREPQWYGGKFYSGEQPGPEPRRPDGESLLSWTKGNKGLDWDDGNGGRKRDIHETELESHGNELREGGKIEHDFNHNQYKTC